MKYITPMFTEKQAKAIDRALREIQQHFEECDEHVPAWKRDIVLILHARILGELMALEARQ